MKFYIIIDIELWSFWGDWLNKDIGDRTSVNCEVYAHLRPLDNEILYTWMSSSVLIAKI